MSESNQEPGRAVDVVVVGAGMAGLHLLHRLRRLGFTAQGFESADDVGGTWYWNRYPGARCDVESLDYSFSFDPELDEEWQWTERYATQPEILRYLQHVADRYDLRRDISFSTRVDRAEWHEDERRWHVHTDRGDVVRCRFHVMATGCLSLPKEPDIPGIDRFDGPTYFTNRWPHEGVDFSGRRVGVIGTGSSGIQSIPLIAKEASELTVFQRTPNFSIPAHNGPVSADKAAQLRADRADYRERARRSRSGVPGVRSDVSALSVTEEERRARYEEAWARGGLFETLSTFSDLAADPAANETIAEFIRGKIRSIVDDPATAEALCPTDHPFGTKRPCLDDDYYATYNLPHVHLVDLRRDPIVTVTETGVDTASGSHELDALVLATGFDAMTGALVAVDIRGTDGLTLAEKWAEGPRTYLGLATVGFPNLFMITGPGSPSVLSNMVVSIEQHVDWICDTLEHLRDNGIETIEPTPTAEEAWVEHVNAFADLTLFPRANSWYMGANVPGKPRVFLPYVGGVDGYRAACEEVVERGYLGFELTGAEGSTCVDGRIRPLQPDVALLLEAMAELDLPPIESLSPDEAREFSRATATRRPPGPEVGEIVDGTFPGATGELAFRLYRPASQGPHPVVLYFHGGGWVLGAADSDDPFCRDLCVRTDAIVVSCDYRHAPENRFPAAVDDAVAALGWVHGAAPELGGEPDRLAVAGWSAGANLAAVVTQWARDHDGPAIAGQALVTPVTDGTTRHGSWDDNAEGLVLTAGLMSWFWDHYAAADDRADPRASPLLADDLSDLPPALVLTAEFDPLRDEGAAYADAMAEAGVEVTHVEAPGQIHTSFTAVDVIRTAADHRARVADHLRAVLAR